MRTMKGVRVRPESPEPTATQPAPERDGGASPRASASASTSPGAPVGPEQPASGPAPPPEASTEPPARLSDGSASMTSGKVDMVDASPKRCSERAKSVWHAQVNTAAELCRRRRAGLTTLTTLPCDPSPCGTRTGEHGSEVLQEEEGRPDYPDPTL